MAPGVRIYPVSLGLSRLNVCRWCAASAATSLHTTGGRMTSADPTRIIASLGLEPTYSAREAAVLLGRSYSWLDQRLREGQFVRLTARPCSRYGHREATGGSLWRCSKTSH